MGERINKTTENRNENDTDDDMNAAIEITDDVRDTMEEKTSDKEAAMKVTIQPDKKKELQERRNITRRQRNIQLKLKPTRTD